MLKRTHLSDTKELDGRLSPMQCPFFGFYRLESDVIVILVEAVETRSRPLLILFSILLFQTVDILGKLLEDLFLELTFGLRALDPVRAISFRLTWRNIDFSFLGRGL